MSTLIYKQYARLLSALENPKRIEIMRVLCVNPATVSELIHMTGIPQSNISQHMQILRREGVVITERKGKQILYCISHPNFAKILEQIHEILSDRKKISPLKRHLKAVSMPKIIDPVCGMAVSPQHAVFSFTYKRTAYYFCASGCKKRFTSNPSEYV